MKKKYCIVLCTLILTAAKVSAQTVVVTDDNTYVTGQASSVLDVKSTSKGFLAPRMTGAQRVAITSPAEGLLVYQTDGTKGFYYYTNSAWAALATGTSSQWTTTGSNIYYNTGNVGIGLTTPTFPLSVKDTLEIRRVGSMSELVFSNTAGSGDLRIAGDGGDIFWQGGGGRNLQMGAYWGIILSGDRQSGSFPAFSNGVANTNVLALAQRDASVPLAVQGNSATQTANLMEWRSSAATLDVVDKNGNVGIGTTTPTKKLDVNGAIVSSATTYPNYAYNTANRMAFGETNVPANETGSVIQFGSGVNTRNMVFAFTKTGVNTSYFGNDGTQMMLGSESTAPITFRTGLVYSSANIMASGTEAMRLTSAGQLGIGTTTPSSALHVVGTNPLTLNGVQTGVVSDSLLTIASGIVRKLPFSTLTSGSSWSLTGNTGTSSGTHFLGTTDNTSLKFGTNNIQGMVLDSLGNAGIGTAPAFTVGTNQEKLLVDAGTTGSFNAIVARGAINNYFQLNIQNQSNGVNASADIVATSDNGNESVNYVDMGINSSTNAQNIMGAANDAYLYTTGNNLLVGTGTAAKALVFMTGGTTQSTNERMRIDGTGNIGMGVTTPAQKLDINGNLKLSGAFMPAGAAGNSGEFLTSSGAGLAPTWINASSYIGAAAWLKAGNSGTNSGTSFIGTTDNTSIRFRTNNVQGMVLDSLGNVGIGAAPAFTTGTNQEALLVDAGTTSSFNAIVARGVINNYFQLNIQNQSNGTSASADIVATADNGTESVNFIDMGINSSANTQNIMGAANDAYLYTTGNNLLIGTGTAAKALVFMTGGTTQSTNERMRIDGSGHAGIGVTTPTATLHLKAGTTPATSAPLKFTAGTNMTTPEAGAVEFDGTNYFVTSGAVRYTMAKTLTATATLNFPSTSGQSSSNLTITVTGAADGDAVQVGVPNASAIANGCYTAYVSAANTVTVRFNNYTLVALDPASGTFRVSVIRY